MSAEREPDEERRYRVNLPPKTMRKFEHWAEVLLASDFSISTAEELQRFARHLIDTGDEQDFDFEDLCIMLALLKTYARSFLEGNPN